MTYKARFLIDGMFQTNGLTFATQDQVADYAKDLISRMPEAKTFEIIETNSEVFQVNAQFVNGKLELLKKEKEQP